MAKKIRYLVKVSFLDLQRMGKSIYRTEEGVDLTMGSLHSGSTFDAAVVFNQDDINDLKAIFEAGAYPVFIMSPIVQKRKSEL